MTQAGGLTVEILDTGGVVRIDCSATPFERDVRVFCERRRKTILAIERDGARALVRIRS